MKTKDEIDRKSEKAQMLLRVNTLFSVIAKELEVTKDDAIHLATGTKESNYSRFLKTKKN